MPYNNHPRINPCLPMLNDTDTIIAIMAHETLNFTALELDTDTRTLQQFLAQNKLTFRLIKTIQSLAGSSLENTQIMLNYYQDYPHKRPEALHLTDADEYCTQLKKNHPEQPSLLTHIRVIAALFWMFDLNEAADLLDTSTEALSNYLSKHHLVIRGRKLHHNKQAQDERPVTPTNQVISAPVDDTPNGWYDLR